MTTPLKNELAESAAQKIAEFWGDKPQMNFVYQQFLKVCPNLKKWETFAIADRARFLAKEKGLT